MGWYECALGGGFILALVATLLLNVQRNINRNKAQQDVRRFIARLSMKEEHPREHS